MISKVKHLAASLAILVPLTVVGAGCSSDREATERWATTENTNVKIDWDKVNEARRLPTLRCMLQQGWGR